MKFLLSALVIDAFRQQLSVSFSAISVVISSSESFRIKRQNDMIFFPDFTDDGPGPVPGPLPRPNGNEITNGGRPRPPAQQPLAQQPSAQQPPATTQAPNNGNRRTTPSPDFLRCMKQCPTTTEYNPVCGSDQVQYHNQQRLNCANNCGARVQFVRRGNCLGVLATNTVRFK